MNERLDDPTAGDGALDPDERFGQGTDGSHPESATGHAIERIEGDAKPDERRTTPPDRTRPA